MINNVKGIIFTAIGSLVGLIVGNAVENKLNEHLIQSFKRRKMLQRRPCCWQQRKPLKLERRKRRRPRMNNPGPLAFAKNSSPIMKRRTIRSSKRIGGIVMKRTITIAMTIVMMVIGMVAPANATKAEAAYVVDGKMRFSVSDAVMEAKYYQERTELRSVLTLYNDTVVVIYGGKIEHVWRAQHSIYADVDGAYMNTYAEHIHAEVLI